jgi:hypothetical protein
MLNCQAWQDTVKAYVATKSHHRGMRVALDDAFKRKNRPLEDAKASPKERPKLRLVK